MVLKREFARRNNAFLRGISLDTLGRSPVKILGSYSYSRLRLKISDITNRF